MAASPYMRMFWADYEADTAHLTTMQHGIYLLLIKNYWQRGGPLPDDDIRLARIAKVTLRTWRQNRAVIGEFFSIRANIWQHQRIDAELTHMRSKSLKNKRPGNTNAKRTRNERDAIETRTPLQAEAEADNTLAKANGGKPPSDDPVKQLFDLGVALLTETGSTEKHARSLIGKWRKAKPDAEVLQALLDCRARSISEPTEWLEKRLKAAKYVSASGYEYRGTLEQIKRESERRADWSVHWRVVGDMKSEGAAH